MFKSAKYITVLFCLCITSIAWAAAASDIVVPIYLVSAKGSQGKSIGNITIKPTQCGIMLVPNLTDLKPGPHGFHIHQNPSCDDFGNAAGGHLDPHDTKAHKGPYETSGHLGDLPFLMVNQNGTATLPVLAPRLTLDQVKGHSLMIHKGADNYSDNPEKNGGGGGRLACGVIK
jgi:Cu-Zn family superoxide dismutase